jgi:hypothetical protein
MKSAVNDSRVLRVLKLSACPKCAWADPMMRDMESGARQIKADAIVGDTIQRAKPEVMQAPYVNVAYSHVQAYEFQRVHYERMRTYRLYVTYDGFDACTARVGPVT